MSLEIPSDTAPCPSDNAGSDQQFTGGRSLYAQHLDHVQGQVDVAASTDALDAWYGQALPPSKRARILDFGCGQGVLLRWLKSHGYHRLEGLDIISDYQQAIHDNTGAEVHVVEDGVDFVGQREACYDAIFCVDVLEHVEKPEAQRMVAAFERALRPGGRLIIAGPHAATSGGVYTRYLDWTHTNCFTVASLNYLLRSAGFADGRAVVPRFKWGMRPTRWALAIMRKAWFAWQRLGYTLEMPGDPTAPPHFYMRLVMWTQKAVSE